MLRAKFFCFVLFFFSFLSRNSLARSCLIHAAADSSSAERASPSQAWAMSGLEACGSIALVQTEWKPTSATAHPRPAGSSLRGPMGRTAAVPASPVGKISISQPAGASGCRTPLNPPPSSPKHMKPAHILWYMSHSKCPFSSRPVLVVLPAPRACSVPTGNTKVEGSLHI